MPESADPPPRSRADVYTKTGDDGTTGLLFGGRVAKDSPITEACGDVDEAQAAIGMARAAAGGTDPLLEAILIDVARDLWVLMAELATAPENRRKLEMGTTLVTDEMVVALERRIDQVSTKFSPPRDFVVPGSDQVSAALDLARTIVRRAERHAVAMAVPESQATIYLNRLSDLMWTLARWQEVTALKAKDI